MSNKKIDSVLHYKATDNTHTFYATTPDGKIIKYEDRGTSAFDYDYVVSQVKKLLGQTLTVIDASYTNERQLKAVKDIIRNHFANELSELWEASESNWEEIIEESTKNMSDEEIEDSAVSLEEVLGA